MKILTRRSLLRRTTQLVASTAAVPYFVPLSALGKAGGGSFSKNDLDLITLFANQVSIAIENASLVKELRSTLDDLEQRVEERIGWNTMLSQFLADSHGRP